MTEVGTRDIPPLNWDVLVTPGIPIATSDLPPAKALLFLQTEIAPQLSIVTMLPKSNFLIY